MGKLLSKPLLSILCLLVGVAANTKTPESRTNNKPSEILMKSKDIEKWAKEFSQKLVLIFNEPKNIKQLEIFTVSPPEMIPPGYMSYQWHLAKRQSKWDQAFEPFLKIIQDSDKNSLAKIDEVQKNGLIDQVDLQTIEIQQLPSPITTRRSLFEFVINELCDFSKQQYKDWKKNFLNQMNELLKNENFISKLHKFAESIEKSEIADRPSFFTLQRHSQILKPLWNSTFGSFQLNLKTSQFPGANENGEETMHFFDFILAQIAKESKEQKVSFLDNPKNKEVLRTFLMSLSVVGPSTPPGS